MRPGGVRHLQTASRFCWSKAGKERGLGRAMVTVSERYSTSLGLSSLFCEWGRLATLSFIDIKRLTDIPGAALSPTICLHRSDGWNSSSPTVTMSERPRQACICLSWHIRTTESRPARNWLQVSCYMKKIHTVALNHSESGFLLLQPNSVLAEGSLLG